MADETKRGGLLNPADHAGLARPFLTGGGEITAKEQVVISSAPKKPPAKKPAPKPKPKPTTRTPAQLAGLAKARDTKAAKDVEITPALIRHVLANVTLRFFPSYGPREAHVINAGREHTVTFGPFPEAARTAADEWSDFLELVIAIDGDATAYPVVGPHDRSD